MNGVDILISLSSQTRSGTPTLNPTPINDNEKEELCNALVSAQKSGAIQILIEACLPTQKDWDVASSIGVPTKSKIGFLLVGI